MHNHTVEDTVWQTDEKYCFIFLSDLQRDREFESRCPTYVGKPSVKCSFKICIAPIHFASCPRSPWNSLKSRVQPLVTVSTNQILPGLWCWRRITMILPPPHFIAWNRLESGPAPPPTPQNPPWFTGAFWGDVVPESMSCSRPHYCNNGTLGIDENWRPQGCERVSAFKSRFLHIRALRDSQRAVPFWRKCLCL